MEKEKAYAIWRGLKKLGLPVVCKYDRELRDWQVEVRDWTRLSQIPELAQWCARNKNLAYTSLGETRVLKRGNKLILY